MTAKTETLIEHLKYLIATALDVEIAIEDIDPDASLFEDGLGLDSIAIVELITLVEEKFEFEFEEDELGMESFENLRRLAEVISNKLA